MLVMSAVSGGVHGASSLLLPGVASLTRAADVVASEALVVSGGVKGVSSLLLTPRDASLVAAIAVLALAVSGGLELLIPTARLAAPVDVTLLAVSGASSSLLLPGLGSMNFKNEFLCV